MSARSKAPAVGAPDPARRTSPIATATDEDFEYAGQEIGSAPVCYFNDVEYSDGAYVSSGTDLLRCVRGVWVNEGSSDPHHP